MKYLFIDTSTNRLIISIINNDNIIFEYNEITEKDMASKILLVIQDAFNRLSFNIADIDKIFVVNGPGSFTGIRVGVTVAKTMAWALKKDLIPLSSLELLATTEVTTKYVTSLIDARRGYVYAATYDKDLNIINNDCYMLFSDIDLNGTTIVSYDNIVGVVRPQIDIIKIINKHKNDKGINPHSLIPNYLKRTEAEENLEKRENDKRS